MASRRVHENVAEAVKILTIQGTPAKIAVVSSGQPQGINDARGIERVFSVYRFRSERILVALSTDFATVMIGIIIVNHAWR
jgi:ABC-type thiamin/hydroxymethylpyrimidine transport system permease subunit